MSDDRSGVKTRLAKNSLFSIFAWLTPIVIGFITTPILVLYLGPEQYGVLAIIYGFISYSLTFSVGKVAAKFIPEFRTTGRKDKLSELVSATLLFGSFVGLVGAVLLAASARYIVSDILLLPPELRETATLSLRIACAAGLLIMIGQTFQYAVQGLHGFGSYLLLTNLSGLMLGVGNIALVLGGYGLVALMYWNLLTTFVTGVLFFIRSKQLLGDLTLTFRIDRSIFASVLGYGGNIILFQIFSNVLYIFERAWVTRKFGADGLTFYAVPMLLAIYLHGVIASFVQALFPHINELLESRDKLINLYQKTTKVVLALAAFICMAYIVAGGTFLSLWLTPDFSLRSYGVLVVHSLTFALLALMIVPLQVAEAFKFSSLTAIVTCVWMAIAIPLMIFAADIWHIEGVAMSRLVVVAVVAFPLAFFVEHKFLGGVFWQFWTSALVRITIAAGATAFFGYHFFNYFRQNWFSLIAGVILCGTLYCGILFASGYLSRREKDLIRSFFANRRLFGFNDSF
jgi:O-antigen/teichoic acid export membrane protein